MIPPPPGRAIGAFEMQRAGAKRRHIEFLFTFEEWWAWWQVDGRWERRGTKADSLVMARYGDVGPYHPENVKCITKSENSKESGVASRARNALKRFERSEMADQAKSRFDLDMRARLRKLLDADGKDYPYQLETLLINAILASGNSFSAVEKLLNQLEQSA